MRLIARLNETLYQPHHKVLHRTAARGILLQDDRILLLYTRRYNDFSLPGGGIDEGEDVLQGLQREMMEETGARSIRVEQDFGYLEEYRPHYKPGHDLMFMRSHFYLCSAAEGFAEPRMEDYEVNNGMEVRWVALHDAITHNRQVMAAGEASMGLSIQRETLVLEKIAAECLVLA
ncbi:MAG: NUDIX domain-containing protein [Marinospirillum sp.]|uniref:NUDIX domain-containing protein n=1 Tax=Marinospirillum sp. TaxID=2183934 RepID=UPI0019FD4613|nr:NUDIX domain-containing protein [Marinospirillum sp.]MBE0507882.1 NUDIX domain-containing protein [Marinospirillum sp.]